MFVYLSMKTTKYSHSIFPTGKGLVIDYNDEITLFYTISDQFTVWHTQQSTTTLGPNGGLKEVLSQLNTDPGYSNQGVSQSGTLAEVLDDMPDSVLGSIYTEVVGYDPFIDDPENPSESRKLVYEYLDMEESLIEVFAYGKDK